jgi:prepilin-type N-terminal cleavage/methylation domain-containing protein
VYIPAGSWYNHSIESAKDCKMKYQKGFTLAEVVVVLLILAAGSGIVFIIQHFLAKVW